jgi:hypothetical protein
MPTTSLLSLDLTALGTFPLCLNQERALLSSAALRQGPVVPPPSLIRFGLNLQGLRDSTAVREALQKVLDRHPALRCSFGPSLLPSPPERQERFEAFRRTGVFEPGMLVQTVHSGVVPALVELDWRELHDDGRKEALRGLVREEDLRWFSDTDTSRMRASLAWIGPTEAQLILTFDHVVFDGFSAAIVRREIERWLSDPAADDAQPRAGDGTGGGFPAFADWQTRTLKTTYFRSSIAFWRDHWAQFARHRIPTENLPFSLPPPKQPDFTFATERTALGADESAAVRAFASAERTTTFAICLAALARVLGSLTERSAVVVWSHLLNRVQPAAIGAAGFFVNTHMLGIDLRAANTGRALVRHAGRVMTSALAHQELPLPHLWSTLRCVPRFGDAHVLLDFRTLPAASEAAGFGVRVDRCALPDPATPRFSSLGTYVLDTGQAIELSVTYWTAAFSQAGVQRMLHDLRTALLALVTDPDADCGSTLAGNRAPNARMEEFLLLDGGCIPLPE